MRLTKHADPSAILNFHALNRVSIKEQKLRRPHTPKANAAAGDVRDGVVAARAPREGGDVEPTASAPHTVAHEWA